MEHKIIAKCIVGSKAYGTYIEGKSDIDYKGIYLQSIDDLITFDYEPQVAINKDEMYYECRRFIELLVNGNPTALELLYSDNDCIEINSPQFELLRQHKDKFLTKKCAKAFGNFGHAQIVKAKGLDKLLNWNYEKIERKNPIDFCYVQIKEKTKPIKEFLETNGFKQENCGLVNLNHFDNCYAMYYDYSGSEKFKGIIGENSNEVRLSPVSKEFAKTNTPFIISYSKDKYSKHCSDFLRYETWLKERNESRYVDVKTHGQKIGQNAIDGKNMLHCTRLLDVAKEICAIGTFTVRRPNAEYLLSIRHGQVPLEKIIEDAERDIAGLEELYKNSNLPDEVDPKFVKELLLQIRKMESTN